MKSWRNFIKYKYYSHIMASTSLIGILISILLLTYAPEAFAALVAFAFFCGVWVVIFRAFQDSR